MPKITNTKSKVYWTTKDGKKLDIDEMKIQHLRNIVKMVAKRIEAEENDYDEIGCDAAWGDQF